MSSSSGTLFETISSKIVDASRATLNNEQLAPWVKLALFLSGLGGLYSANRALNRNALNHGTTATFDWKEEIIVVTGGSGGIGGATVQKLAKRGTTIVVLDVIPLTYAAPPNVHFYKCDLTDYDQLKEIAATVKKEVGEPTIIVANAGICRGKPILKAEKRDIELTFGVNTLGLIWTIKAFLPSLVAHNHGHILIVASQTGYMATSGATDYCSSKAAAVSIYEGIHSEVKHVHKAPSVRISCISPSHVQTSMFNGIKPVPGMSTMTPDYLADTIVGILYSGQAHNVLVPTLGTLLTPFARALPDWVRIAAQDKAAAAFTDLKPHDPTKGQK